MGLSSTNKIKAKKLRMQGLSYNEINKKLGIPKSTLSNWLKDIVISKKAQTRLDKRVHQGLMNGLIKRNKMQTHLARRRARKIQQDAAKEIKQLSKRDLLLIGTALYWGEGYKKLVVRDGKERTWHTVSFSNTDAKMVSIFMRFLKEILCVKEEKIYAIMHLYNHINENEAMLYWMAVTGLSKESFKKSMYKISISSKRKKPFNKLQYGTLQIEVADTKKFHKIIGWINGMKSVI